MIRRLVTAVGSLLARLVVRPFELDGPPLNVSFEPDELFRELPR